MFERYGRPGARLAQAIGCAFAIIVAAAAAADSATVYKWTDADGKQHYSDQPPPDGPAEATQIGTTRDPYTEERLEQMKAEAAASTARREAAKSAAEEEAREAERLAAHCRDSRAKLENLENARRPQFINEQGEREFIDEDKRAEWIKAAQDEIDKHCR